MKEQADSDSGTIRDVLGNVREPWEGLNNTMRLRPEPAEGLDGRLESGLSLFAVTSEVNYE